MISYTDLCRNKPASAASVLVLFQQNSVSSEVDNWTTPPTLAAPATTAILHTGWRLEFTLPEGAAAQSVKLIFTATVPQPLTAAGDGDSEGRVVDTIGTRVVTLGSSFETPGTHSVAVFPPLNQLPPDMGTSVPATELTDGIVYTVSCFYPSLHACP